MELKLKQELQDAYIWVGFVNANIMGKFIDKELYRHIYITAPELFDVIEEPKSKKTTTKIDDLYINNSIQ